MRTFFNLFILFLLLQGFVAQAQQDQDSQWYNAVGRHKDNKAPVKDAIRQKTINRMDSAAHSAWTKLLVGNTLSSVGQVVHPAGTSLSLMEGDRVMSVRIS